MGWRASTLLAVALLGCATPLEDESWLAIDTPNFRVVSALSPAASVQLARDLESFHAAVGFILGKPTPIPPVRTRVYAFDELGFERTFARGGNQWSYFVSSLLGPAIVLRNGGGWRIDATREVRRRYAAYLLRHRDGLGLPLWLDAGLPELASGSVVTDEGVEIGVPPDEFYFVLRKETWIPIDNFLTRDELTLNRGIFDAEAWIFAHHLFFGEPAGAPAMTLVREFRQRVRRGADPTKAVRETLGKSSGALDRRLNLYFRRERLDTMIVRPTGAWRERDATPQPLGRDEALAELGWISVDIGEFDAAERFFEQAVQENPRNARAEAGYGAVEQQKGRWESAAARFNRALGLAPQSAATQLDVAAFYLARAEATPEARPRARLVELARTHIAKCLAINPEFGAAHALSAAIHLVPGEDAEAGLPSIFRAEKLLPGSLEVAMLRGWLLTTIGKPGSANHLARRVISLRPPKLTLTSAEALISATTRR